MLWIGEMRLSNLSDLARALGRIAAGRGSPRDLGQIRDGIESEDTDAVAKSAHTLKSMVGNFCAPTAHAAALKVETAGRNGDLAECVKAQSSLEQAVAQ